MRATVGIVLGMATIVLLVTLGMALLIEYGFRCLDSYPGSPRESYLTEQLAIMMHSAVCEQYS